ncbi:Kinesin-like protein kip2, partial [Rhizopus stolonifer]
AVHIPFRNSKLTRILQAALSGNARISVICTINPTLASKNESLNTLRFAQRAKLVKTAAKMTRILDNSELQNCLIRIAELQTKMQEKNDLEAETRERLKSLLGLILTSSKATGDDDHIHNDEMFSRLSNLSQDTLVNETTMRDVVARCEEGFAAQIEAHQRQMEKMAMNIESMQDTLRVMESVNAKQNETLSKREAHIEKLKQELAASTAAAAAQASSLRASKVPTTSLSSKQKIIDGLEVKKAQQIKDEQEAIEALKQEKTEALARAQDMAELLKKEKAEALRREQDMAEALKQEQKRIEILRQERNEILKKEQQQINEAMRKDQEEQELKMADLTVAISSAAQMITDAISNGMQISVEEDYDMMTTSSVSSAEDVNQAITHTIENVIAASLSTKSTVDTTAITSAIQSAIQSSILSSSMSTHSTSASTPEFTTIQEAISFIQSDPIQLYESFCIVDQDDDVPELILQNSLQKSQHWTTEQCQNFEIEPIRQDIPYTDRAIVNHDSMTTQDDIYKPYSVSIEQPSVFGFLLNRWTFLFAVVYFFSQYF